MLDEIAADTNTGDIIEDLQDQVVQFETCNFSLKAEKEAMNDAIKKMVRNRYVFLLTMGL